MLAGNKSTLAIESVITRAYESKHFKAVGFFAIHLANFRYGICQPEATMMGWHYGEVKARIIRRGSHTAPFSMEIDAGKIADAVRDARYAPNQEQNEFFGFCQPEFLKLVKASSIFWVAAEEGFENSSYILQFDVGPRVRLIGFRLSGRKGDHHHDPSTLRDLWMEADAFYEVLERWRYGFEAEWFATPKLEDSDAW
jgi:hypothetical protein